MLAYRNASLESGLFPAVVLYRREDYSNTQQVKQFSKSEM